MADPILPTGGGHRVGRTVPLACPVAAALPGCITQQHR